MPTLKDAGMLVPPAGENPEKFKKIIPIEYIILWLSKRVPIGDAGIIELAPKGIGDKVLIFMGKTASGKSTVLPPAIFDAFFMPARKNIACLQPKVTNAITIPTDQIIPYNKHLTLGKDIGYQTGSISEPPYRGIIFMTTGIMYRQLKTLTDDEIMDRYSFIIVDECHDRSVDLDITLYLLKKFLKRNWKNSKCPFVICMSATFDYKGFMRYFKTTNFLEVEGASFPVEAHFQAADVDNYIVTITSIVTKIHKDEQDDMRDKLRDILVFVAGAAGIKALTKALDAVNTSQFKSDPLVIIPYTSNNASADSPSYRMIFSDMKQRRVIIATNAIETGVTIDTIKYCIDSGFYNSSEFNPNYEFSALINKPVTIGMATQRRGRAGRKAPGHWYPIYSESSFKSLLETQYPEILKSDITSRVLDILIQEYDLPTGEVKDVIEQAVFSGAASVKHMHNDRKVTGSGYGSVVMAPLMTGGASDKAVAMQINLYDIDLMDLPSMDSFHYALDKLYNLGAITNNMHITRMGYVMSRFGKINIEAVKMILSGYVWGASIDDLILIAAMTGEKSDLFIDSRIEDRELLTKDENARLQLLLADDMIKKIYVFRKAVELFDVPPIKLVYGGKPDKKYKGKPQRRPNTPFEDKNIKQSELLAVIAARDEIMYDLVNAGLDPFHLLEKSLPDLDRIEKSNLEHFNDKVRCIKRCIYEGYKLNMLDCNASDPLKPGCCASYTYRGIPVHIESQLISNKITEVNPTYVIVPATVLRIDQSSNMYSLSAKTVSIMDGFI